jgi:hypothetical protein
LTGSPRDWRASLNAQLADLAARQHAALAGLSAARLWKAWRRAVLEIHVLAHTNF